MKFNELKEGEKILFVDEHKDWFSKTDVLTKYEIYRVNETLYLVFQYVNCIGEDSICSNEIKEIKTSPKENKNISIYNVILENSILSGTYSNDFYFEFNVSDYKVQQLSKKDKERLKEVIFH